MHTMQHLIALKTQQFPNFIYLVLSSSHHHHHQGNKSGLIYKSGPSSCAKILNSLGKTLTRVTSEAELGPAPPRCLPAGGAWPPRILQNAVVLFCTLPAGVFGAIFAEAWFLFGASHMRQHRGEAVSACRRVITVSGAQPREARRERKEKGRPPKLQLQLPSILPRRVVGAPGPRVPVGCFRRGS